MKFNNPYWLFFLTIDRLVPSILSIEIREMPINTQVSCFSKGLSDEDG
jgi:hypothetical protein